MEKISKNFLKESYFITDLRLCSIRLIDNSKFPWIILKPKRKNRPNENVDIIFINLVIRPPI